MADIQKAKEEIRKHLIREEGLRLKPYRCSANVPTIGVGATTYPDGRKVQMSDPPITEIVAFEMLDMEINIYISEVMKMTNQDATTNQLIGLVICSYNIGLEGMRRSTMIKAHNRQDYASAARAFMLWNMKTVNGKKIEAPELIPRRMRESAIYATPDEDAEISKSPQAVHAESKVSTGPIAASGGGLVVTGVLTQIGALFGDASPIISKGAEIANTLGIKPLMVVGAAAIVFGAIAVFYRIKQRHDGWA